jgi:hypothetical protein
MKAPEIIHDKLVKNPAIIDVYLKKIAKKQKHMKIKKEKL